MVRNNSRGFFDVTKSLCGFAMDPFTLPWGDAPVFRKARRYLYRHNFIYGGGVVVCWQRSKLARWKFLLLRRATPWNDWTFPKGQLKKGESPKEGALREGFEESGLKCEIIYRTSPNIYTYFNDSTRTKITNTVDYYLAISKSGKVTFAHAEEDEKKEFLGYKWVSIDQAIAMVKHETERGILREVKGYFQKHG